MDSGIYKILNTKNGKCYIGSAKNFKRRWDTHKNTLRKNKHDNERLQRAWNKYTGWFFEFQIIELCEFEKLLEREQFYLNTLKPEYNICLIAGNCSGKKASEKTKLKMSKSKIGKSSGMLDKTHSDETKEKLSVSMKNNKNNNRRNLKEWPHEKGSDCDCDICYKKRRNYIKNWQYKNDEFFKTLKEVVIWKG